MKISRRPKPAPARRRRGRPDSEVVRDSWVSRRELAAARHHRRQVRNLELRGLADRWLPVVALIQKTTAPWPDAIADYVAAFDPVVARGLRWISDDVAHGLAPLLAPQLRELVRLLGSGAAIHRLAEFVQDPPAAKAPAAPRTSAAAREQYLRAQAVQTRFRILVDRGGFVAREEAAAAVKASLATFKTRWWNVRTQIAPLAGDPHRAHELAARTLGHALRELELLGGLLPVLAETPVPVPARETKAKRKKKAPTRRTRRT